MQNNRRHFLLAGGAGLATLLVPNISQACFCPHRRRNRCETTADQQPFSTCPLTWSATNPWIPDAAHLTPSTAHNITVYGTGLVTWANNGGGFWVSVSDDNSSGVNWMPVASVSLVAGTGGNPDAWTFSESETGSTPGSSSITITIALNAFGRCAGTWSRRPVTYTQS
jgi:hypothetical protein